VTKNEAMPNQHLEAARLKKRWSVEMASKKVGVSVNTFNRWERGLQLPHLNTLDRLCKAFAMSTEELGFTTVISARRRKKASGQESITTDRPEIDGHPSAMTTAQDVVASTTLSSFHSLAYVATDAIPVVQSGVSGEEGGGMTRRQAISLLIRIPTSLLAFTQKTQEQLLYADEILLFSSVNLPLCWRLYYEGGFIELNTVLPGYVQFLSSLAQLPSRHQMWAANLSSQVHQLSYLLALQRQDFGTALYHTQEAIRYGKIAQDTNLQAASIARRAYIYFCLQRRQQKLFTYQEALRYCTTSSPLLKGYIYAGLAEAYATSGDSGRAYEFLKLAHEQYPDRPEEDPAYAYTHFRWPTFYNFAGQIYLHVDQPKQAWEAFATVERLVPPDEEPHRLELTVYQAATALALEEQEQSCALLEKAVRDARALGSNLRYNEAMVIFERMQEKWGRESHVKALANLF